VGFEDSSFQVVASYRDVSSPSFSHGDLVAAELA
jgi:hypothetical protein